MKSSPSLSILICDDHPLVRDGMKSLLARTEEFNITVYETDNGEEAIRISKTLSLDLIFLDIHMKGLNGIETCRQIKDYRKAATSIIALSVSNDPCLIREMIKAGAMAYLLKDSSSDEILTAIRCVLDGKTYFSGDVTLQFLNATSGKTTIPKPRKKALLSYGEKLTNRELDVLALISEGLTNEEIAGNLSISRRTVEMHRQKLLEKFRVRNTAGLIRMAFRKKILE